MSHQSTNTHFLDLSPKKFVSRPLLIPFVSVSHLSDIKVHPLKNQNIPTLSYSRKSSYSPIEALALEHKYVLTNMDANKASYFKLIWLDLMFMLFVTAYGIVMIGEWSKMLNLLDNRQEECSGLSAANMKLIFLHYLHIAAYAWGLVSSIAKLPRGLVGSVVLLVMTLLWRSILTVSYLKSPHTLVAECYSHQKFNFLEQNMYLILAAGVLVDAFGIFLGCQLYTATRTLNRDSSRLEVISDNNAQLRHGREMETYRC